MTLPAVLPEVAIPSDPQTIAKLIEMTINSAKIYAGVVLKHDAAQVWSFKLMLPLGVTVERIQKLSSAMSVAIGVASVRVSNDTGEVIIEVPKPDAARRTLRADRLTKIEPPAPTAIPAGVLTNGHIAWLDLADPRSPHVVIGGTTGSGKTTLLYWMLYRLFCQNDPAHLRTLMLDPKAGELDPFQFSAHLMHPIASSPVEIGRLLAWITDELERRKAERYSRPRLIIVIEELRDLIDTVPGVTRALNRVAQVGRGLGVHLVVTTQYPNADTLREAIANIPTRLIGKIASQTIAYGSTGRAGSGAANLLGNGDFLIVNSEGALRFQAPLLRPGQMTDMPKTQHVATLDDQLPAIVEFADLVGRDPRGGHTRRSLTPDDYAAIESDLRAGRTPDEIKARHGIGWERAKRISLNYNGANA